MHILMLCALEVWALPSGGGAPTLARTLQAYSERGHRVTFVTSTVGANAYLPEGKLARAVRAPAPPLDGFRQEAFHLPSLQESRLPLPAFVTKADQKLRFATLFPLLAARRGARIIDRDPVDLLYGYEVHGVLAMARLQRRRDLPSVARFQGTVLHPFLNSRLGLARRYEEVAAIKTSADLYIMTNDGTRGDAVIAKLNPGAMAKLRFWRNGLDLDRLSPAGQQQRASLRASLGLPPDAFIMLTASRLAAWKRVDRALSAFALTRGSLPNGFLVVLGDGEERPALEEQARALGIEARTLFVGAVPQERVVDYMRASDVLLALAGLSNVGNPLLEAMCCGLPAIAVDAGDTRELVRNGETGVLVAEGDQPAIASSIIETSDNSVREQLSQGARRYALEHFWSWEERLQAEIDAVESLAKPDEDPANDG